MLKILLYTLKKVKYGGMLFRTSSYQQGWLSDALVQCPSQRFEHNDGPCPTSCDLTGLAE